MSAMSVRLPDWLHKQLRVCAKREGVSINQLISSAAAEKLAAIMTEEYIAERAKRGSRRRFEAALKGVPDVEPEPFDRLPRRSKFEVRRKKATR
ncbi:MAG: toxin-antitoxin system HicB family antitoxin [Planctomycetes bacterium]|nr:toxin-antitoxin system HicB family antitoxin [Planctomycetota bacterium]